MTPSARPLTVGALAIAIATSAPAQEVGIRHAFGYFGTTHTPVAALPPRATPFMTGATRGLGVSLRYSYVGYGELTFAEEAAGVIGGSVEFAAGRGRLGITGGVADVRCANPDPDVAEVDCDSQTLFGAEWGLGLVSATIGDGAESGRLTVGLEARGGYGTASYRFESGTVFEFESRSYSASLGLPVALAVGDAVKVVPFVTPTFAYGRHHLEVVIRPDFGGSLEDRFHKTGTLLILGGGVGVSGLASTIDLSFGFWKPFLNEAGTTYGVSGTVYFAR